MSSPSTAAVEASDQTCDLPVAYIRSVFAQLIVQPADRIESEKLEIKNWCHDEKQLSEKLSEVASCLANAGGGFIVIGVDDKGPRPFSRCPYPNVTPEWISRRIHDNTYPAVENYAFDASHILEDVTGTEGADAFVVSVPRTKNIGKHITGGGISKIRVGKECRPNFTAEDDRTRLCIPDATIDDLSVKSIEWAIAEHRRHFSRHQGLWSSPWEFLLQAKLLEGARSQDSRSLRVPLATMLLFGTEAALSRHLGYLETVVKSPLGTMHIRKNIVESYRELADTRAAMIPQVCPNLGHETLKELLVNAYIHRCYRVGGAVVISANPEFFEVQNPGELAPGIRSDNLIYCLPFYRNLLLADGARFIGLCDQIGQGIDLVYGSVLSGGFDFPIFESEAGKFSAHIPLVGSQNFQEFVRRRSQSLSSLDEIVVLRILFSQQEASFDELCSGMQRGKEVALKVLKQMGSKAMIERLSDSAFTLPPVIRRDIEHIFQSDQLTFEGHLFGEY